VVTAAAGGNHCLLAEHRDGHPNPGAIRGFFCASNLRRPSETPIRDATVRKRSRRVLAGCPPRPGADEAHDTPACPTTSTTRTRRPSNLPPADAVPVSSTAAKARCKRRTRLIQSAAQRRYDGSAPRRQTITLHGLTRSAALPLSLYTARSCLSTEPNPSRPTTSSCGEWRAAQPWRPWLCSPG